MKPRTAPHLTTISQRNAARLRGLKAMRGSIGKARKKGALNGMLAAASLASGAHITLPKIKFMEEGT